MANHEEAASGEVNIEANIQDFRYVYPPVDPGIIAGLTPEQKEYFTAQAEIVARYPRQSLLVTDEEVEAGRQRLEQLVGNPDYADPLASKALVGMDGIVAFAAFEKRRLLIETDLEAAGLAYPENPTNY